MTTKHTPGPLSVSFGTKWPFEILIIDESGNAVYQESLPCYSSEDKNFEEALNCWNFKTSEQKEYAAINHRAVADAYLRAAAPDLLEALRRACNYIDKLGGTSSPYRVLLARATGEEP